jgi:hypothetical protein
MARTDLFAVVTIESNLDVTADLHAEAAIEWTRRRTHTLPDILESSVDLEEIQSTPGWRLRAAEQLIKQKVRPAVFRRQAPACGHPTR